MEKIEGFFDILSDMQWSDYLDIALVAYLIYLVLPLIRSNSTMRIARAVFAVVIIAWLTEEWQLYTLNFILNQFMTIGLLALVILFQPELRRMLDRLGNVKLRSLFAGPKPAQEMERVIAETVMACEIMGREKVGALIVFSREMNLAEYTKTGTSIDGQVSEQLIRNIFFPKAALHDGAMIIRDGRVTAAGCVLPLSDINRLTADLGTRHRAGVGISEVSDAVVIIVAEETGTISVAVGGMLKRHLAPQTLVRLLYNELCPEQPEKEQQNPVLLLKQKLTGKGKEHDRYEK